MDFHPIQKIKAHIAKLRKDMEPMTTREKLDHLWTYYKWVLVVLAVLIVIVCVSVTGYKNTHTKLMFSGAILNTNVSLDGQNFLDTEFVQTLGGDPEKQKSYLINLLFEDPMTTDQVEYAYNAVLKITASISVQELDYILTDTVGLETCLSQDALLDLSQVLTPEELEQYGSSLKYLQYEGTDKKIPVAVELENHPFAASGYMTYTQPTYLAFIANTPRLETCRQFWDYISAVEPASPAE